MNDIASVNELKSWGEGKEGRREGGKGKRKGEERENTVSKSVKFIC